MSEKKGAERGRAKRPDEVQREGRESVASVKKMLVGESHQTQADLHAT